MTTAIVFRPSPNADATLQRLVSSCSDGHIINHPASEVALLETANGSFDMKFAGGWKKLADYGLPHILPSVVALSATCYSEWGFWSALTAVTFLIGQLEEIRVVIGNSVCTTASRAVLQALHRGCPPHLRLLHVELDLHGRDSSEVFGIAMDMATLVSHLPTLEVLSLPIGLVTSWGQTVNALSTLPGLHSLTFQPGDAPHSLWLAQASARTAQRFPRLRELCITASPNHCADIIEVLSASLSTLRMRWDELLDGEEIGTVLRRIAASAAFGPSDYLLSPLPVVGGTAVFPAVSHTPPLSTLTTLNIAITHGPAEFVDLRSLYALSGMLRFSLVHPEPLFYDEYAITDLLSAWPSVQSVSLNPRPSKGLGPGRLPSIRVLEDVARCGPALREFSACLHGFEDLLSFQHVVPLTWESLHRLDLGHSIGSLQPEDVEVAAEHILGLFPGVNLSRHDCAKWPIALAKAVEQRDKMN